MDSDWITLSDIVGAIVDYFVEKYEVTSYVNYYHNSHTDYRSCKVTIVHLKPVRNKEFNIDINCKEISIGYCGLNTNPCYEIPLSPFNEWPVILLTDPEMLYKLERTFLRVLYDDAGPQLCTIGTA